MPKKTRKRNGASLSIWIEPDLRAKLDLIAERDRRSISSVARLAVEDYVFLRLDAKAKQVSA